MPVHGQFAQLFQPMRIIMHAYTQIKTQTVSLDRVEEFLATEPEIKDEGGRLKADPESALRADD